MFIRRMASHLPKGLSFPENIPSSSGKVLNVVKASFTKYPISTHFSPTLPKITSSTLSFNSKTSQVSSRSFSTTSQAPSNSSILEESLTKLEQNPEEAPKIIKSLPLETRKELALALVEKRPEIVANNIGLFEIEDEKTRIELFRAAANSKNNPYSNSHRWREGLFQDFKNFNIKDKAFITKLAPFSLRYCNDLESTLKALDITDSETLESALLRISEEKPDALLLNNRPLSAELKKLNITKPDFIEKIILNILENIKILVLTGGQFLLDYPLRELAKDLPNLTTNRGLYERVALKIAEKSPADLIGRLKSLQLSEEILKEIIPKILPNMRTYSEMSLFSEELGTLGIKDQAFIDKVALSYGEHSACLAGSLEPLHLSEKALKEVISKIVTIELKSHYHPHNLEKLLKELPVLGIKDDAFIMDIISSIAKVKPEALVRSLKALNLPSDILKTLITQIVKSSMRTSDLVNLVKELPKLSTLNDPSFIEKTTLDILEQDPYALMGNLQPLNLKEDVVKHIISKLVESCITESDANRNLGTQRTKVYAGILQDLLTLKEDQPFIESILLKISKDDPYAILRDLEDLKVQDKETLSKILLNVIPYYSGYPDSLVDVISTFSIQEAKFLIPITLEIILRRRELERSSPSYSDLMNKLSKQDDITKLPFFAQKLGIGDLTLRKDIAKILIRESPEKLALSLKLLGLEGPGIFEKILTDVLTEEKVSDQTLSLLVQDEHLSDKITPFHFLDRWNFLADNKLESKKIFLDFLQRPEIQVSLNQIPSSSFKDNLLYTLALLDKNPNISPIEKLEKLITLCDVKADPLPSIEELTGNLILFDITSSHYGMHVYTIRLNSLLSLGIQNPIFFEKAALALAKKNPLPLLIYGIEKFNISNVKALEAIGTAILLRLQDNYYLFSDFGDTANSSLFFTFKNIVKLSKASLLSILTDFGNNLPAEKRFLPPEALGEIFSQITKYRNESLSDTYLKTVLDNLISSEVHDYQKSLALYTIPEKTKNSPPITIHKILPAIYLAKWDSLISKEDTKSRQILSDFFNNAEIRKTLRNQVAYPLTQTLLFALKDLDKDQSLQPEEKLKLIAEVCNLQKSPPPSPMEITTNLRTLSFLCSLQLGSNLNHPFTKSAGEEISTVFKQVAIQNSLVPDLDKIENIEENYIKTFIEEANISGGLATYEANLKTLPPSKELISELSRFVKSCLKGTSEEERYNLDLNPNLRAIFETFPKVFQRWKESLPPILVESSEKPSEVTSLQEVKFIPLIEKELTEYKEESQKPELERINANLSKLAKTSLDPKEQLRLLHLIEKDLYLLTPVPMDALKALEKPISLLNPAGQKQKLSIQDIGTPRTLFELPTLVCQTCQNIKAGPSTAQCLIDYAIGGNTRMIAIQDSSKKFQARAVLRLFYEEGKPFLLLEPVYHSQKISKEDAEKAIIEGALQKALSLNIPLFTLDSSANAIPYRKVINFLGGAGTFYSDYCIDENGRHIISNTSQKLITAPLKEVTTENFERPSLRSPTS